MESNKSADTPKCKCGGRTALISGQWYYSPDTEPYENGIQEKSKVSDDEEWIIGFKCDDCDSIQDVFVDEENYKSEINNLQSRITQLERRNKHLQEYKDEERLRRSNFALTVNKLQEENHKYKEALEKIQQWQMDYVEIARSTKVYQLAEQALNPKDR